MTSSEFTPLLEELHALLVQERAALTSLDREQIAHLAEEKLRLDASLRALLDTQAPVPEDRARLQHIQGLARGNQLLLAHARSCVEGTLKLLSGECYGAPSRTAPNPVAVNLRG